MAVQSLAATWRQRQHRYDGICLCGGLIAALRAVHGDAGIGIASQADLKSADVVVVIGADPSRRSRPCRKRCEIRRRARQVQDHRVSTERRFAIMPTRSCCSSRRDDTALLAGLMSARSPKRGPSSKASMPEEVVIALTLPLRRRAFRGTDHACAKAYAAAKNPVVAIGTGSPPAKRHRRRREPGAPQGRRCVPIMPEANAWSDADGCLSDLGPGFAAIKKTARVCRHAVGMKRSSSRATFPMRT